MDSPEVEGSKMITFDIIKKSSQSKARLGILKTPHGTVETPSLVPVATRATVKTLDSGEIFKTKSQILIANTYHLHIKPGEDIVKKSGGLQKFMNCKESLSPENILRLS